MRLLLSIGTGIIAVAGCVIGMPQASANDLACFSGTTCYFVSPSRNLSCEMHTDGGPASAYCQSNSAVQSVTMDANGNITPCSGNQCMGDPALDTPTLAYGQTARLGPFACRSETDGVTCTAAAGRGFVINRDGVFPVA